MPSRSTAPILTSQAFMQQHRTFAQQHAQQQSIIARQRTQISTFAQQHAQQQRIIIRQRAQIVTLTQQFTQGQAQIDGLLAALTRCASTSSPAQNDIPSHNHQTNMDANTSADTDTTANTNDLELTRPTQSNSSNLKTGFFLPSESKSPTHGHRKQSDNQPSLGYFQHSDRSPFPPVIPFSYDYFPQLSVGSVKNYERSSLSNYSYGDGAMSEYDSPESTEDSSSSLTKNPENNTRVISFKM
jgi:Tfp pilus assembly major pilin PilA